MLKKIFFLSLVVLAISACKKEDDLTPSSASSSNRLLNNSDFEGRIKYVYQPVPSEKRSGSASSWDFIAEVSSPVVNGAVLSATGVEFHNNKAYVSYHWNGQGSDYAGAIEIFDVSNPNVPVLISQLLFTDTDLNEITVDNGDVYVTGGRDIYSSNYDQNFTNGAIVERVALDGAGLLTATTTQSPLPSYSGNAVKKIGNELYVAAGNTGGGAYVVDASTLALLDSESYSDSKFVDEANGKIVYYRGGANAKLYSHTGGFNAATKTTIDISASVSPVNGKAVLHIDGPLAYVCTGANGLKVFNVNSASTTPSYSFSSGGSGYANGVHTDNEFLFIANGYDGVYILDKNSHAQDGLFNFTGSANYVKSNGNNVFIANGVGGLKILGRSAENVDIYCSNMTGFEDYLGGANGQVTLTAMGHYLENGYYGRRWRIRNASNVAKTIDWEVLQNGATGTYTIPAMTEVHFTSHFTATTSGTFTMKIYENGNFIQARPHGGSVRDLSMCSGQNNNDYSLYFDGSGDFTGCDHQLTNDFTFTLSAWFKTDGTVGATDRVVAGLANNNNPHLQFGIRLGKEDGSSNAGKLIMNSKSSANNASEAVSNNRYDDSKWHHAAAVYDGSQMKLYLDGQLVATAPIQLSAPVHTLNTWAAGRWADKTPDGYFKGWIDQVSVWNTGLTATQVQTVFNNTFSIPTPGLDYIWTFDEGAGNINLNSISNVAFATMYDNTTFSTDTPF